MLSQHICLCPVREIEEGISILGLGLHEGMRLIYKEARRALKLSSQVGWNGGTKHLPQ